MRAVVGGTVLTRALHRIVTKQKKREKRKETLQIRRHAPLHVSLGHCELFASIDISGVEAKSLDTQICERGAVEDGYADAEDTAYAQGITAGCGAPGFGGGEEWILEYGQQVSESQDTTTTTISTTTETTTSTTTTITTTTETTTSTTTTITTTSKTTTTTTTSDWQYDQLLCKSSTEYCSAHDVMLGWKEEGGEENVILASDASFGPQAYLPIKDKEFAYAKRRPNCSLSFHSEATGKLVVIPRQTGCFFAVSVLEAQEAGAVGVVFFDNGDTNNDAGMIGAYRMRASNMAQVEAITIPSIMIEQEFGARLVLAILATSSSERRIRQDAGSGVALMGSFACNYTEANAPAGYSDGSYTLGETKYILMDAAGCDHGYTQIISQGECAGAAAKIRDALTEKSTEKSNVVIGDFGDSTPNTGILLFPWPNKYPKGCYYMCNNSPDDQLFWNHAGVSTTESTDSTRRSICKKKDDTLFTNEYAKELSALQASDAVSAMIPANVYNYNENEEQCLMDDSAIPGLGRAVEGSECSGSFCTPDGICIPELDIDGLPWSPSDFVPGMSMAECGRQATNAGLEVGLEGVDSFDCNAYEVLVACTRATLDYFPITGAILLLDVTGTACHIVEETLNVFKADAAANGCEVFDLFASECVDWVEKYLGFSVSEIFVVDLIIKGAIWYVGNIGIPLVKFVIKAVKTVIAFFFGGGHEPAITYYAACASSDSTTSDGQIIDSDGNSTCLVDCSSGADTTVAGIIGTIGALFISVLF
jgi:hypothetical protein